MTHITFTSLPMGGFEILSSASGQLLGRVAWDIWEDVWLYEPVPNIIITGQELRSLAKFVTNLEEL